MRFIRLQAVAFGPLEARSFAVDSDIILVHGPNEAGKSSVRAAIDTVLYGGANVDELDLAAKMIHDLLIALRMPTLDGEIHLAAGNDQPERRAGSFDLFDPGKPLLLLIGDVDIAFERGGPYFEIELTVQIVDESVHEVVGRLIALLDERVVTLDGFYVWVFLVERLQLRGVQARGATTGGIEGSNSP